MIMYLTALVPAAGKEQNQQHKGEKEKNTIRNFA